MARTCQCPTCGRQFTVADELTNTFVSCPSCRTEVKVSATGIQTEPPVVEPVERGATESREERIVTPAARYKVRQASSGIADDMEEPLWPASLPKGRAMFAVATLGARAMTDLALIGAEVLEYLNLESTSTSTNPEQDLNIFEILISLAGLSHLFVSIVAAVAFCMWFYRAYKNLKIWRIPGLKYSPGWAVGYFFIPILNLFRPYQIAQEIWKASDPQVPLEAGAQWQNNKGSSLVGAWWTFWLFGNIVGQIAFRLSRSNISDPKGFMLVSIASYFLWIMAAGLAIFVVLRIQARQSEKREVIITETAPTS